MTSLLTDIRILEINCNAVFLETNTTKIRNQFVWYLQLVLTYYSQSDLLVWMSSFPVVNRSSGILLMSKGKIWKKKHEIYQTSMHFSKVICVTLTTKRSMMCGKYWHIKRGSTSFKYICFKLSSCWDGHVGTEVI